MPYLDQGGLDTLWAKLKAWFAAKTHTHAATDITSGTLSIARGGTGETSAEGARSNIDAVCKSGDTITGRIARSGGGSWKNSRDNVAVYGSSSGQASGASFNVCVGQATNSGVWAIGNLSGDERLCFAYTKDSDYSAESNTSYPVYMPVGSSVYSGGSELALTSIINWSRLNVVSGTGAVYFNPTGAQDVLVIAYVTRSGTMHFCSALLNYNWLDGTYEVHMTGGSSRSVGGDCHAACIFNGSLGSSSYMYGSYFYINGVNYASSATWYVYVR